MSYHIRVHRELYTIVSHLQSNDLSTEELNRFLGEIISVGESFIEDGLPALYHILVADESKFDFGGMLRPLSGLRQNEAMIAVRRQLNMMTILVGEGKQALQFTQHMMSTPQYGGRPIALMPTLDLALETVRRDIEAHGFSTPPPAAAESGG